MIPIQPGETMEEDYSLSAPFRPSQTLHAQQLSTGGTY